MDVLNQNFNCCNLILKMKLVQIIDDKNHLYYYQLTWYVGA